jgi:gliding motility-associated-like protein
MLRLGLILLLTVFLFGISQAQVAEEITVTDKQNTVDRLACADQYAGTIDMGSVLSQSNDIGFDRSFLCFLDRFQILHNSDENLTGDPNTSTQPGIGYAWYKSPPTISGPDLTTIISDPAVFDLIPPPAGIFIYVDDINGDAWFINENVPGTSQSIPEFFNGGDPLEIWFAPITFDAMLDGQAEFESTGPCVNVNIDEAFSVVYLNQIQTGDKGTVAAGSECLTTMTVTGGLPQFDNSFYDIDIYLSNNFTVKGSLASTDYTHGDIIEFTTTEPGVYIISIEDGKSCGYSFETYIGCGETTLSLGNLTGEPGDTVCVPITANAFNDINSMEYSLAFNPSTIQYYQLNNIHPELAGNTFVTNEVQSESGYIAIQWIHPDLFANIGVTFPDNTVIFEMCFILVGDPGDCSDIFFSNNPTQIGFSTPGPTVNDPAISVPASLETGSICITSENLFLTVDYCSSPGVGSMTGSFTVSPIVGMPPYDFTWRKTDNTLSGFHIFNAEGETLTIENLPAGSYELRVEDALGAVYMITIIITNGVRPEINDYLITNPSCPGFSNGSIEIIDFSAQTPHSFAWSNNIFGADNISNLTEGVYSVTLTDVNGCEISEEFPLLTSEIIIDYEVVRNATCEAIPDGEVNITVSGGTPIDGNKYEYKLNNFPYVTQLSFTSWPILHAGWNQLTIRDDNGCIKEDSIWVDALRIIELSDVDITEPNCAGENNGSAIITISTTGTPPGIPYNYDWRDEMNTLVPNTPLPPDQSEAVNLSAGTYTIHLEDIDGCPLDTFIVINEPDSILISESNVIPESCTTGNDGEITVSVTGGTVNSPSDYSYSWTGSTSTSATAFGLQAGLYIVEVTDLNNCVSTLEILLPKQDAPIIDSFNITPASCAGANDGAITIWVSPGDGNITSISWSNSDTGTSISGLMADVYTVTIASDNGCDITADFEVTEPIGMDLTNIIITPPYCPGDSDGSIAIEITGAETYTWSVSGAPNGPVLTGLVAGDYSVTITDANDCEEIIIDTTVVDPPAILADITGVSPTTCSYTSDGGAFVTASGGTNPAQTFNFTWSSGETTDIATMLPGGIQYVVVNDFFCVDSFEVIVPSPDRITYTEVDKEDVTCFGDTDGSITIEGDGGTGSHSYTWDVGSGPTQSNLGAGNYPVTITDDNSCILDTFITILTPDILVASIDAAGTENVSCNGLQDGMISIVHSGGNAGSFDYSWTGNVSQSASATNLNQGMYIITVTDSKGCQDTTGYAIIQPPAITAVIPTPENPACFGETTEIIVESAAGGNGPSFTYQVENGPSVPVGTPYDIQAGIYALNVFDSKGCSFDTVINIIEPLEIIVNLGPDQTIELGDSFWLNPNIQSENPIESITWTPSDYLSCDNCVPLFITPFTDIFYTIEVIDSNGCIATDDLRVFVGTVRHVFIPSGFSPNDDGVNDLFQIYAGKGVAMIKNFSVFNRWGDMVYTDKNQFPTLNNGPGWDGTYRGKKLSTGVYVYFAEIEFLDGEIITYRGDITLLR